jgi:hypothetical protein
MPLPGRHADQRSGKKHPLISGGKGCDKPSEMTIQRRYFKIITRQSSPLPFL